MEGKRIINRFYVGLNNKEMLCLEKKKYIFCKDAFGLARLLLLLLSYCKY